MRRPLTEEITWGRQCNLPEAAFRCPGAGEAAAFVGPPGPCYSARGSSGQISQAACSVLYEYGHIGILVIVAIIFPLGAVVTSWALGFVRIRPTVPSDPVKEDTYECGLRTEGPTLVQFNFRFYNIALLFVLFDVEIVFLFPWAVVYDRVGWTGYTEGIGFIAILCLGILYAWRKRALEYR